MKTFSKSLFSFSLALAGLGLPVEGQSLRVNLDLVLVTVTVVDENQRPVMDLKIDDLAVWEDGIEQELKYFSTEAGPISVGITLDVSHSMQDEALLMRDAAVAFLTSGSTEDEYFLMEFDNNPRMLQGFTRDVGSLSSRLLSRSPSGNTALYDAIYLGLSEVESGSNPRKALLVLSDGEDNRSRYSFSDLEEILRESEVQVYAIGLSATFGRPLLHDLTTLTGGTVFYTDDPSELDEICRKLALEMQSQYVLGYLSDNTARDGRWRDIRVRVKPGRPAGRLTVRSKRGYYAPSF